MEKLVERILEICCDSLESAIIAQNAGAHRIELCEDLLAGGVTPSGAKISLLKKHLDIPIMVLIRPRPGDFVYNQWEKETILENIQIAKRLGADGIVAGALTEGLDLDLPFIKEMMAVSGDLPFVFHKAFDVCLDDKKALDQLVKLGVNRLLTSGQQATAVDGKGDIAEYIQAYGNQIEIMAGGGIRPNNLEEIKKIEGLAHFHSAAKIWKKSTISENEKWLIVDEQMVRSMKKILQLN